LGPFIEFILFFQFHSSIQNFKLSSHFFSSNLFLILLIVIVFLFVLFFSISSFNPKL
jgi:uncharacterized membrane protein